jgi:hypothetical protein
MDEEKSMLGIIIDAINNVLHIPKTIKAYRALLNWNTLQPHDKKIKLSRRNIAEFSDYSEYVTDIHILMHDIIKAILQEKQGTIVDEQENTNAKAGVACVVLTKKGIRCVYEVSMDNPIWAYEELMAQYIFHKAAYDDRGCRLKSLVKLSEDGKRLEMI